MSPVGVYGLNHFVIACSKCIQLAAKRAVVAVTWTQARVRDLTAMEHLISYTFQKVGCPRITLMSEQRECIEHMYEGKDVIVWLPTGLAFSRGSFPPYKK